MSKKTTFGAGLLLAAFSSVSSAALADQPLSACDPNRIFQVYNHASRAFGGDGCVYSLIGGRAFPLANYNLNEPRGARNFENEVRRAESAERREIARIDRESAQRQRQTQSCANEIQRGLNRGIDLSGAVRMLSRCSP